MLRRFENLNVECWLYPERLGVSRVALCLFQDRAGDGRAMLEALDELKGESSNSAKRAITFKRSPRKGAVSIMRFRLTPPRDDLRAMNISVAKDVATIEMTDAGWEAVREAFVAWCEGGEDFCVSPTRAITSRRDLGELDRGSLALWFWGPTMTTS